MQRVPHERVIIQLPGDREHVHRAGCQRVSIDDCAGVVCGELPDRIGVGVRAADRITFRVPPVVIEDLDELSR